jgi:protein-tyrosine phosphatase
MPLRNVLYVCTGNVFRSPVAAEMTKQLLRETDTKVESAGILRYNGPPLPRSIIELTKRHGIDLSAHKPRQVNANLVEAADLILVFDSRQIGEMTEKFPQARNKTYMIKNYASYQDGKDMEDLWGKPAEVFQLFIRDLRVYVERCVNRIKYEKTRQDIEMKNLSRPKDIK